MRVKKVPGNRKRKRIFGAWILLLMAVLAAGTAIAFAEEGGSGSYSFTIQKKFAEGTPREVQNAAQGQKYTFRVEGTDGGEKFVKTVTITGEKTETVGGFSNPPQISVIEQTDDGHFQVGDEHWDVTGTYCESSIHVTQTTADVSISKDGGTIKVTREAGLPEATFQLTGELTHSGESYGPVTKPVPGDGSTVTLGSELKAGTYHIEKLRAKEGFEVLVGKRDFDVLENGTGEVHINGNDSKLLITAPGSEGDGRTHYYQISDVNHRDTREIVLQSGEKGTVEHLSEGDYTIKVSKTYAGFKGYTLTVPQTSTKTVNKRSSAVTQSDKPAFKFFTTGTCDYIKSLSYGPLYDEKGATLPATVTYRFNYGALDPSNTKSIRYWYMTNTNKANSKDLTVTLGSEIVRNPVDNKLYFCASEVSSSSAARLGVSWVEATRNKNPTETKVAERDAGMWYKVMVDDRGWLTISKEADSNGRGGDVKYYYTIINSNGNPITYTKATDQDGNPVTVTTSNEGRVVMLKAGESVTFEGLKGNGYYRVKETVEAAEPMGFHVELEDTSKSTTFVGGSIDIEIKGQRTVDIKKFGDASSGDTREYTFDIFRDGEDTPVNGQPIHLKAGESTKVSEQTGFMLEPGKYTIKATNDAVRGFDVTYGDSSNITADKSVNAVVTFTNTFGQVDASYHVIHEYYLKNSDGTLTFQGASPVFTKNCGMVQPEENKFYTKDVHQLLMFEGNTYQHVDDGYGKVVSWEKGSEAKTVPLEEEEDQLYNGSYQADLTGSSENGEIEYAYQPLTNMEYAQAISHHETEDPAHILILRYVREKTEVEQGKYNIIHVYYKRTSQGDVWEGSSELKEVVFTPLTDNDRYTSHDADEVTKQRSFTPTKDNPEGRVYDYTYDGAVYGRLVDSGNTGEGTTGDGKEYQKDETMTSVRPTVEGDQIIVLRYFREGGYNVVHEYYYREKANTSEGSGDVEETPGEDAGDQTTPEEQGGAPQPLSLDGEDSFNGTLTDKDGYTYTFEGHSSISLHSDRLGTEHDGSSVDKEYSFRPVGDEEHEYRFIDAVYGYAEHEAYTLAPYMTGVTANADYDEIIILRYFRDESDPEKPPVNPDKPPVNPDNPPENPDNPPENPDNPPENPDNPPENPDNPPKDPDNPPKDPDNPPKDPDNPPKDPENPPENPENPPEDPENPPEDPENPPEDPENPPENPENPPENPGYPTELPDPNDPDSPDTITIWEDGVPKAYMKVWDPENEAWIYIPEEDVPLWNSRVPKTGDESRIELWAALAAASLGGIVVLTLEPKKRKNK